MSGTTPPGWFDDGQHPGRLRYWDGDQWTEHFRDGDETPSVATASVATGDRPVGPMTYTTGYEPKHALTGRGGSLTWVWLAPLLVVAGAGVAILALWLAGTL